MNCSCEQKDIFYVFVIVTAKLEAFFLSEFSSIALKECQLILLDEEV